MYVAIEFAPWPARRTLPIPWPFDIESDMTRRRYRIPSSSALVAFESAARHCNFSRAAEELNTSQPAISRHISELEGRLSTRLFEREKRRLRLSESGAQYYRAVVAGLDGIHAAGLAIEREQQPNVVTIACSHEISHLFLMPRYEALQQALGEDIQIRIVTCEYEALAESPDPHIDLMFVYRSAGADDSHSATLFREVVVPVAAPAFVERHALDAGRGKDAGEDPRGNDRGGDNSAGGGDGGDWSGLTLLKLTKRNHGWATWSDWFTRRGEPNTAPRYLQFDNYVYLLEAATAGRGLALGWRGLIERYIDNGALVAAGAGEESFERRLLAQLSANGQQRELARRCLGFLRRAAAQPLG